MNHDPITSHQQKGSNVRRDLQEKPKWAKMTGTYTLLKENQREPFANHHETFLALWSLMLYNSSSSVHYGQYPWDGPRQAPGGCQSASVVGLLYGKTLLIKAFTLEASK